jgi:hypothetical protein
MGLWLECSSCGCPRRLWLLLLLLLLLLYSYS